MTREHFWPLWLIDFAEVHEDGVRWVNGPNMNPRTATLPMCLDCNNRLGSELEEPMSRVLPALEAGEGINDGQAETILRWLWKFEGLSWAFAYLDEPDWHYSPRWTLIQRVLEAPLEPIRNQFTIAAALANQNDEGFSDWPMGLDSPVGNYDAVFMSGVFRRTAVMVGLSRFANLIPPSFTQHTLLAQPTADSAPTIFPPTSFPSCKHAIDVTIGASVHLKRAHEDYAAETSRNQMFHIAKPRLIIPN